MFAENRLIVFWPTLRNDRIDNEDPKAAIP
jgi:hypothetical protein